MHPSSRGSRPAALAALLVLVAGCARVDATVRVVNGPTAAEVGAVEVRALAAEADPLSPGIWAISPSTATITVTGVGFLREGQDPDSAHVVPVEGCTATYDRALGSLAPLGDCVASVPAGTYAGLVVGFETTFEVVVDDEEAGIWSDPDADGLLVAARPADGPRAVSLTDTNTDATGGFAHVFVDEPFVVEEGGAPEVSVLFDPTHWFKVTFDGTTFREPRAMGNPPILPSVDGFAKASFYSNLGGSGAYRWDGCSFESCMSLLFLYSDAETPYAVTWQDKDICPGVRGGRMPVVAFAGDAMRWGDFGRLGLDAEGTLAWASGEQSAEGDSSILGYTGVYRMPEAAVPGELVDLDYRCTTDVPPPTSGTTYASGAPAFTPDGSLSMTLLY